MTSIPSACLLREVSVLPSGNAAHIARQRYRDEALELIARESLISPAFSFRIANLERPAGEMLHVGGENICAPRLLPESGELTALACAVVTLGPRLEQRAALLFAERCYSLALALDDLGNALLWAAIRRAQDRTMLAANKRGLTMAGELRPGDPGLALEAQSAVLRIADAAAIGVSLSRGHALRPLKSVSMVLGVGVDLPPARWSRCDDCPSRMRCQVVARAAQVAAA
jgi:hypothetical protein